MSRLPVKCKSYIQDIGALWTPRVPAAAGALRALRTLGALRALGTPAAL